RRPRRRVSRPSGIRHTLWSGSKYCAKSATLTWAMCSKKVPRPRDCAIALIQPPSSSRNSNQHAFGRDSHWQHLRSRFRNCLLNPVPGSENDQKKNATAAAGSADLRSDCAVAPRDFDQLVDERSGDAGRILAAMGPFLAEQTGHFLPIAALKRLPHGV